MPSSDAGNGPAEVDGRRMSNGSQLKLILLAFALVCLLIALFMPL